ncbi:PEP-CTERM sorting domain-containing protein [Tropicimonas sp. IMCC34043]|uniref:PEP-CTERM sorting domain-containing protein n=1 Tax=Tropicimonas sp. IMCC34043 TaxID=2248760 RepID=UPI000E24C1A2|nr:PEP-CTERM sorting domain-containing protein [Tropicimonas sp. IMCC34043]
MRLLLSAAFVVAAAGPIHAMTWSLDSYVDYPLVDENETGLQLTQGIAWNAAAGEWVTSWQYGLARFTEDWQFISATGHIDLSTMNVVSGIPQELADQGFDHIGDFEVRDGVIHASLDSAEGDYQNGHVALFDAVTLEYLGDLYPMIGDETNPRNDVASWTAIDAETGLGYGKEWQLGDTINIYDVTDWSFLGTLEMDQSLSSIQGAKVLDGMMYLSSDNDTMSIYGLDLSTGHVTELFQLDGVDGASIEVEGLALRTLGDGTVEMYVEMIANPGGGSELDAYTRLYRYVGIPSPVPVPATLPLALSGLAAFALARRRR